MSKLPRTHDRPSAGEAYDPARLEEAFGAFAERVRELEAVATELRAELRSLRAERAGPPRYDEERWPVEHRSNLSPDWVAAVPPPQARSFAIPRIVLEGAFLLLVALCAGLADLSAAWIVLVMVGAWTLVVLFEWAAAAKRARWRLEEIAPPLEAAAADTTGPWGMPVVEATVVDPGPDPESKTIVTTLPAEPGETEQEPAPEPAPGRLRRRGLRRRRQPAEAGAADPWEA
jgi:hypothetical protein